MLNSRLVEFKSIMIHGGRRVDFNTEQARNLFQIVDVEMNIAQTYQSIDDACHIEALTSISSKIEPSLSQDSFPSPIIDGRGVRIIRLPTSSSVGVGGDACYFVLVDRFLSGILQIAGLEKPRSLRPKLTFRSRLLPSPWEACEWSEEGKEKLAMHPPVLV